MGLVCKNSGTASTPDSKPVRVRAGKLPGDCYAKQQARRVKDESGILLRLLGRIWQSFALVTARQVSQRARPLRGEVPEVILNFLKLSYKRVQTPTDSLAASPSVSYSPSRPLDRVAPVYVRESAVASRNSRREGRRC